MWKVKSMGGIKLINMKIKSETSKTKWLIRNSNGPYFESASRYFRKAYRQTKRKHKWAGSAICRKLLYKKAFKNKKHVL